jgi:hypothetical protein
MRRLVVRAGVAAAVLCAVNAVLILLLPLLLPYWKPVWLIMPLVGIDVAPVPTSGMLRGDAAVSIGLGAALVLAASFYLDHCVIDQPTWATWLGWGMLLGGTVTAATQDILRSSHTLYIDINHDLSSLGQVEVAIGAAVVLVSWLRAPELFLPHVRRWKAFAWIAAASAVEVGGTRIGIPFVLSSLLVITISLIVLTGTSLVVRLTDGTGGQGLDAPGHDHVTTT